MRFIEFVANLQQLIHTNIPALTVNSDCFTYIMSITNYVSCVSQSVCIDDALT